MALRWIGCAGLSDQLCARWREGDESPGLMQLEPAAVDREFEADAVLGRAAPVTEQERLVDFLDVDAALNRLDRVGDFEYPARGLFRVGVGSGGSQFHE